MKSAMNRRGEAQADDFYWAEGPVEFFLSGD